MTLKPKTKIIAKCAAKLNLTFEIVGDLPGGYHEVTTLLQAIDLEDEVSLTLEPGNSKIVFASYKSEVPGDFPRTESNLIARAIRKFQEVVPCSCEYDIHIEVEKRIPIGAGLAGGSANAAAALVAMNEHFENPVSRNQLLEIGAALGADVPFSICGGTRLGKHRGDVLEELDACNTTSNGCKFDYPKMFFMLVKPRHLSVSTIWAYKTYDESQASPQRYKPAPAPSEVLAGKTVVRRQVPGTATRRCADAIMTGDHEGLVESLRNSLEAVVFEEHPTLETLRQRIVELGAWSCRMTGSGPTLYALAADREHSHQLRRKLKEQRDLNIDELDIWLAESVEHGARIVSNTPG